MDSRNIGLNIQRARSLVSMMSPEEAIRVIHERHLVAGLSGDGLRGILVDRLTSALDPVLQDFAPETRRLLLGDALGIIYWLHVFDAQIVLDDHRVIAGTVEVLKATLLPLVDLDRAIKGLSSYSRAEINADLQNEVFRRFFTALNPPSEFRASAYQRYVIALKLCLLTAKSISGTFRRAASSVSAASQNRLVAGTQSLTDICEILEHIRALAAAIYVEDPRIRILLGRKLTNSRLLSVVISIARGHPGKRDRATLAHLLVRSAIQWGLVVGESLAKQNPAAFRGGPVGVNQPATLDHVREAIFYLTHAWEWRTGLDANRKTLNGDTTNRYKEKGIPVNAQTANTPYERFVNAALEAIRPLNKRPAKAEVGLLKPYDAQIKEVLSGGYKPRPVEWISP